MSDPMEEAVEQIKAMGISHNDEQIREALQQCNNNPQEAIQLLLPESPIDSNLPHSGYRIIHPTVRYGRDDSRDSRESYDDDVDMRDTETHPGSGGESDHDSTTVSYSLDEDNLRDVDEEVEFRQGQLEGDLDGNDFPPEGRPDGAPPRYEDIVTDNQGISPDEGEPPPLTDEAGCDKETTPTPRETVEARQVASIEFPLTHYYELEGRVHTEQWSVPFKRNESLAICIVSSIKMIREGPGIAEGDENCKKFMEKTIPDAFQKLITHEAVFRWDQTIMEGILDMCRLLMELIAERLHQKPIPVYLLNVLSMVFNADANYHTKMKNKRCDNSKWNRVLGENNVFALMPHFQTHKDPKGWLVEIMNIFAQHGGILAVKEAILNTEDITLQELTALFQPFSMCEDYINPIYLKQELSKCILRAMRFIHELSDGKLKDKEVGCVSDLLKAIKTLLVRCSLRELVATVDNLRLDTTIRMLNIPHFNAKMNALKEVVRLTEEPFQAAARGVRSPITAERITDWLVDNKVLSIALGGNLHQSQYTEKLKSIVEFLGPKLSMEELTTIWDMQVDKNPVQIENVHGILAAAASRCTSLHLDHLFQLISQSWEMASDRYREKLLELIGKIGKDDRQGKTASKILELLWRLAHLPQLSREMVELALDSHSSILIDSYHTKDAEKKTYIAKCVEDIKKGTWVVSALRQLHRFAKGFFRTGYHKDQHHIAELQRQHDLLRLVSSSMMKCHSKAVQECKLKEETLSGEILIDGRYSHRECVDVHLKFLGFLLQDGALYLPNKRASEVWDTLISNPEACTADRELAFKWFDKGMTDLEHESQVFIFNTRVLKVEPSVLDSAGYSCLRNFFETINLSERKLKRISGTLNLIVENPELTGIDYLWRAALEVRDTKIADELINNILQITYQGLSSKLKKESRAIHERFIDQCFLHLEDLMDDTGAAPRTSTGKVSDSDLKLQAIERLLLLAQRYITVVEEGFHFPRSQPPHGSCFLGHPFILHISPDQPKTEFDLECHSNESILSVKQKIAKKLDVSPEQLQIGLSERWLDTSDNNKLIYQMGFSDRQLIIVKTHTIVSSYSSKVSETKEGNAQRQALAQEQERSLPGVIMAGRRELFDKLEQLCTLNSARVITGVHNLLMLIPTNHAISDALEVFIHQTPGGASEDPDTPLSPQAVLEKYITPSSTSPTQLLYNLEVLSSRLIPTGQRERETDESTTQLFRRTFLEYGGLKFVINVLQKNALPSDVDLTVRQDCYAISLSLARFLLCNQAMHPPPVVSYRQHSSASQSSAVPMEEGEGDKPTDGEGVESLIDSGNEEKAKLSKVMSTEDEVARLTIETMSVDDFATMLAYLMRVCWSAAAGQLHLASIGDSEPSSPAQSLRGKPSPSPAPPDGNITRLKAGICTQQESVSAKNAAIARESLELLITCLKLRSSLLNIFYTLPHVEDFVIDILLGCPHPDIRVSVVCQLDQLCQAIGTECACPTYSETTPVKRQKTSSTENPHHFFIHLLLKHPDGLWDRAESAENSAHWERCTEYFNLLYQLLYCLQEYEQTNLSVDVHQMMHTELEWFRDVDSAPGTSSFQCVLAGHLHLCRALFTCEGVDKKKYGQDLCVQLISKFLFPASRMIQESQEPLQGIVNINPVCTEVGSRVAAYDLLVELSSGCYNNFELITTQLILMHHRPDPQIAKEWEVDLVPSAACWLKTFQFCHHRLQPLIENSVQDFNLYQPPVVGRSTCGYVGLRNAGATCYMNSVLQQLYMTQKIREVILSAELEQEDESILPELQGVFGHLLESKLQYYSPENFWKKFKLWGQPVNVREQQDAFDFFCNLTDQVDEQLKAKSCPQVFQEVFGGAFLDQKICKGCDHTYDREESFLSLPLPVKSKKQLEESLKEFVKGDWLEGDNAYFCEKCQEKRDTLKRTCIKTLPQVLVVHLKRFDYDWEAGRAIKYDDYFEFPWVLDMEPYTADGIARQEQEEEIPAKQQLFELVGIVVHSGQASAGHYYSFIKEKRIQEISTSAIPEDEIIDASSGKWLRFNDNLVDEFTMSEASLEAECFGGSYKAKANDAHSSHPETRIRYWNAYMLFYEAMEHPKKDLSSTRRPSDTSPMSPITSDGDKLNQLQALIQKGERRQVFSDTMPASIQRSINEENLQFMQHRDVYCPEYFVFINGLAVANMPTALNCDHSESSQFGLTSMQLAINFLFHTYFRTRKKLRSDMEYWIRNVEQLLRFCQSACLWFMELLTNQHGTNYIKPLLLECTNKEVRQSFCRILSQTVESYIRFGNSIEEGPIDQIIDCLLDMLEKDVVDNSKSCAEYFEFFRNYSSSPLGCRHLITKDAFVVFMNFLLGSSKLTPRQDKAPPRRWSSNQVKEFGPLYSTLSLLVRNTDISVFETETDPKEEPQLNPYMISSQIGDLQTPSEGMHQALFNIEHSKRFIKECVLTLRESDLAASDAIAGTFCYCCWNNQSFSACAIEDLQIQIGTVQSNELKTYFRVLTDILLISDSLQTKRISFTISGGKYQPHVSIFSTIQSNSSSQADSKKAYQGIKFLVGLANKCKPAREFLLSHSAEWQWAVGWLRKKLSSDYYKWSQSSSNETSHSKSFQRTVSAQDTLEEANALLNELEARDSHQTPQVAGSSGRGSASTDRTYDNSNEHSSIEQIEG